MDESDKPLQGEVAVVTGGAGKLGTQFSRTLAEAGATVVVADKDLSGAKHTADRLRGQYGEAHCVEIDVAEPSSVDRALNWIDQELGRLDVLVNNAGIAVFSSFQDRTMEEFMEVLRTNLGGTFLCSKRGVQLMRETPTTGRIINIGSIYGIVSGDPRIYTDCDRNTSEVYGASKAGVIQMTKHLAVHLSGEVRVNAISPGGVFDNQGEDFVTNYAARTPLNRMAEENEMNGALLFLATEASSYVTGHNLVVDGGWTAW